MITPDMRQAVLQQHARRAPISARGLTLLYVLLLAALLFCASNAHGQTAPLVFGNLADIVSTELAVQRPGVYEVNPFMGQSVGQRIAVKTATTAAQVWLVRRIGRRHPTAAKVIGYSVGAVLTGIAVRNVSHLRRRM